jgi:hypothetical protein
MWMSKLQNTIVLSSTKAELTALSEAVKQALYVRKMLTPLKINDQLISIYNDNQSALVLTNQTHQAFHVRMKYLEVVRVIARERQYVWVR